MHTVTRRLGAIAALCLCSGLANAFSFTQVIAFGDSLSDTGNLATLTSGAIPPASDYYNGRFSNGPLWVESMSADLGLSLTNYAVGGAQTGAGNVYGAYPGLATQLAQFTGDLGGGMADPGALYTVFAGSNNFCDTCLLTALANPTAFINQGVTELLGAISSLQANGAESIMVFGLPDLGLTPRALDAAIPDLAAQLSGLTDAWNTSLFDNLPGLGIGNLRTVDTAALLRDAVGNPGNYGFSNTTQACLAVADCVNEIIDQDGFVFWDDIHPTRATHAILGDVAYNAALVPVPPAAWLFASAVSLLAWMRRRLPTE